MTDQQYKEYDQIVSKSLEYIATSTNNPREIVLEDFDDVDEMPYIIAMLNLYRTCFNATLYFNGTIFKYLKLKMKYRFLKIKYVFFNSKIATRKFRDISSNTCDRAQCSYSKLMDIYNEYYRKVK